MGLTNSSVGRQAIDSGLEIRKKSESDLVVALAGNPNVGKSTVFNALTGMNQHTGNWPGKTVANAQGSFSGKSRRYTLVDLPGTYSLTAHSAEEEIARNFICFAKPDIVAVVCDATCLERSMNLVLQTLEITENKNVKLFKDFKVFSETELKARYEIELENYSKTIRIEALTMTDMVNKDILPSIEKYLGEIAKTADRKAKLSIDSTYELTRLKKLSALQTAILGGVESLETALAEINEKSSQKEAEYYHDVVFKKMQELRAVVDRAEMLMPSTVWPYPTYGDLLFGVR